MGLYAGDLNAAAAWDLLSAKAASVLVDVRTPTEWQVVGIPDLSSLEKEPVLLSWRNQPSFDINQNFLNEIASRNIPKEAEIVLLCKVGGRSMEAAIALTQNGYKNCYNLEGGMEDISGWKASGLPWRNVA